MSEAVNPNMHPEKPLPHPDCSIDAQTSHLAGAASETPMNQSDGEKWQVVDFPGALGVDAIPLSTESDSSIAPSSSSVDRVEQLQQENQALRDQVAQLAEDLAQLQIEFQLEVTRFYCKDTEATASPKGAAEASPAEDWATLHARIQHLTGELEAEQQSQQQQRALLDRLTQQLEHSQQRVAQLERDCAVTQGRYAEQVQLVSQAESTCCDLRMRLHRQQQQTLQFKAALEKSIEINATANATANATVEAASIASLPPSDDAAQAFIPKAQPVQPWSTAPGAASRLFSVSRSHAAGLPNLLSKLVRHPQPEQSPAIESLSTASDSSQPVAATPVEPAELLNSSASGNIDALFPSVVNSTPVSDVEPLEPIFDLSPFIEAGEVDANSIADAKPQAESIHHPAKESPQAAAPVIEPFQSGDALWADLARLIEPELTKPELIEPELIEPNLSQEPILTAPDVALTPIEATTNDAASGMMDDRVASKPISLVSFQLLESADDRSAEDLPAATNPFPSFNLHSVVEDPVVKDAEANAQPCESQPVSALPPNWPAPILYPFRQPKKLKSMAAVDLPSFPRG